MGELTRKAASSPIPNPLSDFPSVWCAAIGFSVFSMPFYRHQSVWRRDTTRPVSPGVGHEFVKLESCLFLFFSSPLHFTLSPRFSRRASEPFPPDLAWISTKGQRVLRNIRKNTWRRGYATMYYFFQFQFSILGDGRRTGKKIALFVSV